MLLVGNLFERDEARDFITGEIYTYYDLDASSPWFNINRSEEALDEEVKHIVIPAELKPDLARFAFAFDVSVHRLFLQLRSGKRTIGIISAASAIKKLFSLSEVTGGATVEVTVEPFKETLDRILNMHQLHTLLVELVRPNPDDHYAFDGIIEERLRQMSAAKISYELVSEPGSSLQPDDEIKELAKVASSNGFVVGTGRDQLNRPARISTRDTPLIESTRYDPAQSSIIDFIVSEARRIGRQFRGLNRND